MIGRHVTDWLGQRITLRLVGGHVVTGMLTDWSCTPDGTPITLVLDGEAVIPWTAVAVVT